MGRAWEAVERHALPWLDAFSRVDTLIEHCEREIEPTGLLDSLRHALSLDRAVRPPRRDFLLWLGLLYERKGEIEPARRFLARCLAAVEAREGRAAQERERIEEHLSVLCGTGDIVEGLARD